MGTGVARSVPNQKETRVKRALLSDQPLRVASPCRRASSQTGRRGHKHTSDWSLKTSCSIPLCQLKEIEKVYGVVRPEVDLEPHSAATSVALDYVVEFWKVVDPRGSHGDLPVDGPSATLPHSVSEGLADGVRLPW